MVDNSSVATGNWASRNSGGGFTMVSDGHVSTYLPLAQPSALTGLSNHTLLLGMSGESTARIAIDADGTVSYGPGGEKPFTGSCSVAAMCKAADGPQWEIQTLAWDPPELSPGERSKLSIASPNLHRGAICHASHDGMLEQFMVLAVTAGDGSARVFLKNEEEEAVDLPMGTLRVACLPAPSIPTKTDDQPNPDKLCATWENDPVACVRRIANVEWTSLLPFRSAASFTAAQCNSMPHGCVTYGQNAMPIGNGDFGALVSTDGIDTVIVALKAASAYDESGQIFAPGVLNITFSPVPDASPFTMHFDVGTASVTVRIGSLKVLLWFDAAGDKLVVQHSSSDATVYTATANIFVGRPHAQTVPGQIHWDCYTYTTSADHIANTSTGTAFYHYNPPTPKGDRNDYWSNQVTGMNMGSSTYESVPNILQMRTSGGLLRVLDAQTMT
eukprot:COSAG04_NODE_3776_length_2539_cov_1.580738_3_plen_442_part_01